MSQPSSSDHWGFFRLPPFFTQQPSPATVERQINLWGNLLVDHATYYAQQQQSDANSDVCSCVRFYSTHSDIFSNPAINRRLSASGARTMLEALLVSHPNHTVLVEDNGPDDYSVLVATTEGGFSALEESLLSWVLEMGQGTTTAMLAKKGAVMTFNELAESKCLEYKQKPLRFLSRRSTEIPAVRDVGCLTEEQALRTLLQARNNRPVSVLAPFKITLFNMDGSTKQPYEGVKFGG